MPTNMPAAEFYWREAERLYSMTEAEMFADVRDGLLDMAHRYERLADESELLAQQKYAPSRIIRKDAIDFTRV